MKPGLDVNTGGGLQYYINVGNDLGGPPSGHIALLLLVK